MIANGLWDGDEPPAPGYYRVRLVKGGPWVPARVYIPCPVDPWFGHHIERPRWLLADVDGKPTDPQFVTLRNARRLERITEEEWALLTETAQWARHYAPDEPVANPKAPIDLLSAPLPF